MWFILKHWTPWIWCLAGLCFTAPLCWGPALLCLLLHSFIACLPWGNILSWAVHEDGFKLTRSLHHFTQGFLPVVSTEPKGELESTRKRYLNDVNSVSSYAAKESMARDVDASALGVLSGFRRSLSCCLFLFVGFSQASLTGGTSRNKSLEPCSSWTHEL